MIENQHFVDLSYVVPYFLEFCNWDFEKKIK